VIGHKIKIKTAGFQLSGKILMMLEVEIGVCIGTWIAPCSAMDACRAHEGTKV
jgi:hypothetical protein